MAGNMQIGIRVSEEEKKAFDVIADKPLVKSNRGLFRQFLAVYLPFGSYALHLKAADLSAEIAYRGKKAEAIAAEKASASEEKAYELELEAAANTVFLGNARIDAEIVVKMLDLIANTIEEVRKSPLDIPNNRQGVNRFAESMIRTYRLNTDPCYRRNMEINSLVPKEDTDE